MADFENKMFYTQADSALTNAFQTFSFSADGGTTTIVPNAIIVKNNDTSGSNTVIYQINDSPTAGNGSIAFGKGIRYSIKKVKHFALKFGTSAPNWSVQAVR